MKDQAALDRFLSENGIDGVRGQASRGPALSGMPLFNLAQRLRSFRAILGKIDRRCDARVVAALLRSTDLDLADYRDKAKVEAAANALRTRLEQRHPDLCPLDVTGDWGKEHSAGRIIV